MDLTTYQILCLCGVPTIIGIIIGHVTTLYSKKRREIAALEKGLQSLLRRQLRNEYRHYVEKGWCSIEDRDDFEYMYQQYHSLGENGVMDDLHDKFMALPTQRPNS